MAYSGYLIKFGGSNGQLLPEGIILSYSSKPNQRLDLSAERDNTGYLHRYTLANGKTAIKFSVHMLHLAEKIALQNAINAAINVSGGDAVERKGFIQYWDDENNEYKTGWFYIPDVEYIVMDFDSNDIIYEPIEFELIEY